MKDKIKQLAQIYTMVERGEISPAQFFLAFRSRFGDEIKNSRNQWRKAHTEWKSLDWSKIENDPLLSQLLI